MYTINAVPFGGFVKIFGEDSKSPMSDIGENVDKERSFQYKPKWIQALVLVAGVFMNLIFAWLLISLGFMIGLSSLHLPIHLALVEGARATIFLTKGTILGLGSFLKNIILFKADFSEVSGIVGIAGIFSVATSLGFTHITSLVALISINLAVINLIPFPVLDGGRLLFVFIEGIIRRPMPVKVVKYANAVGFVFLLVLMVAVTGHDIFKLL